MSTALEIALFLASVAVVVFVSLFIPVLIGLRNHAAHARRDLEEMKSDLKLLVQDSRTMVQNVNSLTGRAHEQLDEVEKVVQIVRGWSDRANRIVGEVGDVVEAPIFTVARIIGIVHKGLNVLLDAVAKTDRQPESKNTEPLAQKPRKPTVRRTKNS